MDKITFEIYKYSYKRIFKKSKEVFIQQFTKEKKSEKQIEWKIRKFLNKIKKGKSYFKGVWDDTFWVEEKIPKAKSFPKFNNEVPFYHKWDGKYRKGSKILRIRWTGEWEYKLKHIGHENEYVKESDLFNTKPKI